MYKYKPKKLTTTLNHEPWTINSAPWARNQFTMIQNVCPQAQNPNRYSLLIIPSIFNPKSWKQIPKSSMVNYKYKYYI